MDEQPVQLISESRRPIPPTAGPGGRPERLDYEYVREGTCCVWMFVEPLGCWRDVQVTPRRTAVDWAEQIRRLVEQPQYAKAQRITLVLDNLNTHQVGSFYEAFPPDEARRLARKIELIFTPKHGSWLNMAEPELSVLTRQALDDRIDSLSKVTHRATAWTQQRNEKQTGIDWQFTTKKARVKLKYLYPHIKT